MPSIDLNKTLIIHTIVDEIQGVDKWQNLFEINKEILNYFGYNNIYLLKASPKIIKTYTNNYNPFQRLELFLYQDMKILENYDYVIYTELDAFLIKPIEEFQKICDGVEEEAIMFLDYEKIIKKQYPKIMFCLLSVNFYKKIISCVKKEFEVIKKIGHKTYKQHCASVLPKSIKYTAIEDDLIWGYIIKKYKLNKIVHLNCISPNKKEYLRHFVNCHFDGYKLIREKDDICAPNLFPYDEVIAEPITYSLEIDIDKVFFLHVLGIEKNEKKERFFNYLYKKIKMPNKKGIKNEKS